MKIRLMPHMILAKILRKTKEGSVYLPDNIEYTSYAGMKPNFWPLEVEVIDVGSKVMDCQVGDKLRLSHIPPDKLDEEHVIFPETHTGKFYDSRSWKELPRKYTNVGSFRSAKTPQQKATMMRAFKKHLKEAYAGIPDDCIKEGFISHAFED